jgi:carbon storage regulator
MLVLSRGENEEIIVGDPLTPDLAELLVITVVRVRGDKVKVGVSAPKDIPVHRREVFDAIRRDRAEQLRQLPVRDDALAGSDGK